MKALLVLLFSFSVLANEPNCDREFVSFDEFDEYIAKYIQKNNDVPSPEQVYKMKRFKEMSNKEVTQYLNDRISLVVKHKAGIHESVIDNFKKVLVKHLSSKNFFIPSISDFADLTGTPVSVLRKLDPNIPEETRLFKDYIFSLVESDPVVVEALNKNMKKYLKEFYEKYQILPVGSKHRLELAEANGLSKKEMKIFWPALNGTEAEQVAFYTAIIREDEKTFEKAVKNFAKQYAELSYKRGITPSLDELAKYINVSSKDVEMMVGKGKLFDEEAVLYNFAKMHFDAKFMHVTSRMYFNNAKRKVFFKELGEKRFQIYTSAVGGAKVREDVYQAMLRMKEYNDGVLSISPVENMSAHLDPMLYEADKINHHLNVSSFEVIPTLRVINGQVTAKQINGMTGYQRIGPRQGFTILPSTKIAVDTVSTAQNGANPLQYYLTGTITGENYHTKGLSKAVQQRTNTIAKYDHTLGAVIVELDDTIARKTGQKANPQAHIRHVKFDEELGGIVDNGLLYRPDGVYKMPKSKALIFGDLHGVQMMEQQAPAIKEAIHYHDFEYLVLHDFFDGYSINHHDKNPLSRTAKAQKGTNSLRGEISQAIAMVNAFMMMKKDFRIVVPPSNHDYWLQRFKTQGWYMEDSENYHLAKAVELAYEEGKHPLEYLMVNGENFGFNPLIDKDRIRFLQPGEAFKFTNGEQGAALKEIHVGYHGDNGMFGRSVSLNQLRKSTHSAVIGHTHILQQRVSNQTRDIVKIGAMTVEQGYALNSFSSVGSSYAVVDASLNVQVFQNLNLLHRFFLDPELRKKKLKNVVISPKVLEEFEPNHNYDLDNGGGVDQHRGIIRIE
jgi:hypothetical protein